LVEDQAYHHTDGEGATAESETVDGVVNEALSRRNWPNEGASIVFRRTEVSTDEFVDIDYIALEPVAERTTEDGERFE